MQPAPPPTASSPTPCTHSPMGILLDASYVQTLNEELGGGESPICEPSGLQYRRDPAARFWVGRLSNDTAGQRLTWEPSRHVLSLPGQRF